MKMIRRTSEKLTAAHNNMQSSLDSSSSSSSWNLGMYFLPFVQEILSLSERILKERVHEDKKCVLNIQTKRKYESQKSSDSR